MCFRRRSKHYSKSFKLLRTGMLMSGVAAGINSRYNNSKNGLSRSIMAWRAKTVIGRRLKSKSYESELFAPLIES